MNENESKGKEFITYTDNSKGKSNGNSKSFIVPFFSGILGASIVIGTCFGVPTIRENILGSNNKTSIETISTTPTTNLQAISLTDYSDTAISVANKVLPSVVGITVEYSVSSPFMFNSSSTAKATGSGIIISSDGYILTNNHIINSSSNSSYYSVSEATKVTVNLYNDKTEYEAKIVGTDAVTDLAVIKIEKNDLVAAELGDSNSLQVGEFAMAIGNPLGLDSSITCGVISALNREVKDTDGTTYNLIQTDAAINSGNSGGALVNSKGQVIGINTLKLLGTGIEGMGFAIPISSTTDIYNQLIQYNKVKRPYLGITGIDVNEKTAAYYKLAVGVYVKSVDDFSASQKAGIKAGDVIIAINDTTVTTMSEINEIKNKYKIGDTINIKINRNGEEKTLSLTLEEQP